MSEKSSVILEKETSTGAVNVSLHPLVLVNISDHWTRERVQKEIKNPRVIGALLGVQSNRDIEIFNSFELINVQDNKIEGGSVKIDLTFLANKLEQIKKVHPTYEFIGWYSTGQKVLENDINVHKQFLETNESPLYLMLDPLKAADPNTKELPISIYESELRMVKEVATTYFVRTAYKIETGEAERISVDHIARILQAKSGDSLLTAHLTGVFNAISMLSQRIEVLQRYAKDTKDGKNAPDYPLLRRLNSLCNQLPAIDSTSFKQEFIQEYNDALLITLLASMTKGSNSINELIDKFNLSNERRGMHQMMGMMSRGMFK